MISVGNVQFHLLSKPPGAQLYNKNKLLHLQFYALAPHITMSEMYKHILKRKGQ